MHPRSMRSSDAINVDCSPKYILIARDAGLWAGTSPARPPRGGTPPKMSETEMPLGGGTPPKTSETEMPLVGRTPSKTSETNKTKYEEIRRDKKRYDEIRRDKEK